MAWVKLDDKFPDHAKVAAAGPLASWLYVCGLAYCNRMLTDGFIPAAIVRRLADVDDVPALARRLVCAGLWEEADGGYRVHDYLEYQPSRDEAAALSDARAEAGRKGGKQRGSNLLAARLVDASSKPEAKSKPVPGPVPVPEPIPVGVSAHADTAPAREAPAPAAFAAFWAVYPKKAGRAKALDAWRALKPDADTADAILAGVDAWKAGRRWREGFVMEPARWLKERRWEDEPETDAGPVRSPPANRRPKLDMDAAASAIDAALSGNSNGAHQHDDGSIEVRLRHPAGLLAGPIRGPG